MGVAQSSGSARSVSEAFKAPRKMTGAMMRLTVSITIAISLLAGALQLFLDLFQEMETVESSAAALVESLVPAAENAVWDFDEGSAGRVVDGLFMHGAVTRVSIYNEADLFYARSREIEHTVPILGHLFNTDNTVIDRYLMVPVKSSTSNSESEQLGQIEIELDRTVVSPNVVQRLINYFLIAFLKNVVLCACLVVLAFSGLARHALRLATSLSNWRPADGAVALAPPPKYLRDTEIEMLGRNIEQLTQIAGQEYVSISMSNSRFADLNAALETKSENLSQKLQRKNFELKAKNEKLLELATRDGLTGAFNRRHFDQLAEEYWDNRETDLKALSIILADIDYFKRYNDHFGHGEGDACLRTVATFIKSKVEESGGIFARYGGEEFIILLPSMEAPGDLARDLIDGVAALRISHPKSQVADHVTISIGLAQNAKVGAETLDDLIAAADSALYEAKRLGRNRVHTVRADFIAMTQMEEAQESALRKAIRNRAFEPFYQPQYDARTDTITGVEVLARWRKEDGGLISPIEIFGTAEKLGLVEQIDDIIQQKAISDLNGWIERGIAPPKVAINVSEHTLLSGQISRLYEAQSETIRRILSFELLETIGFDNKSATFNMRLDELIELGAAIEIDDFGTGVTSINTLSFLAPKRLKIARELVAMIGQTARGEAVVKAVVEIAQSFGIELIAEGVESKDRSRTLIALGIPIQQGFLFAHPMSAEELEVLLRGSTNLHLSA